MPIFPKWTNLLREAIAIVALTLPIYLVVLVNYGASPRTTDVGYMPNQPAFFKHSRHAGDLGLDCRYCHSTVEVAGMAAIPPTQTCMNCHTQIQADHPDLEAVRQSYATGRPVEWIRVHDLPDYSYFNHAAHLNAGVGCESCHGRVDKMDVVWQVEPLSMGWCIDCHRNPAPHLRPFDQITRMGWTPDSEEVQKQRMQDRNITPQRLVQLQDCSTCHR